MSQQEAARFAEAVKGDAGLKAEVKAAGTVEAAAALAKAKGYDVSAADLQAHGEAKKGELSEEDLAKVAGGSSSVEVVVVVGVTIAAT
jgi:predicted ribosomally synthesized peptide with nif11-like leader